MTTSTRERRDWTLLIFIIPIGIILMLIAGQVAIRLVPIWSINAGMQSKLDPNNLPKQQSAPIQPVLPAILTPLGWLDTFLTPGAGSGNQDTVFAPFVVFEPSATPEVTIPPPTVATVTQPSPTIPVTGTSPTVVVTPPVTVTKKPPVEETPTPPTATQSPTAQPTATLPTTPVPVISTPNVGMQATSTPGGLNIGAPDISASNLGDGYFTVLDLGSNPSNQIRVNGTSDTNYDMVYYEIYNLACLGVCMDQVIIGISNDSTGGTFYTVFNWSGGGPDLNSNVGDVAGAELDNQSIPTSEFYGSFPYQTGVAIDVDNAPSHPLSGTYRYIVVQAPVTDASDGADINAIEIVEIPNPSPLVKSALSAEDAPSPQVEEVPNLPAAEALNSPAEEVPNPQVEEVPNPPAEDAPNSP